VTRRRWLVALAPILAFYGIFFLLPQVTYMQVSLYPSTGPADYGDVPGLQNYEEVVSDAFYRAAFVQTLALSTIVSLVSLLLGYLVAYEITRSTTRLGSLMFLVCMASLFLSTVVRALGWQVILAESGPVNGVLAALGLVERPVQLTGNFLGAVIGLVHIQIPLIVLLLLPVMEAVSPSLNDAARGLGASRWYAFWTIFFPLTRRGALSAGLLVFATTAGAFTTVALMGGGRLSVMSLLVWQQTLQLLNYPLGATLAVILVLVVLAVVAIASLMVSRVRIGARVG
jgi:putative spermidine/putrescine transport system permease protein